MSPWIGRSDGVWCSSGGLHGEGGGRRRELLYPVPVFVERAVSMPDSSGATVFDDLPEWLVVDEILVRLPPKDILRCRAVRKSWRSSTSTDKFILDHLRRQPSLPIILHRNSDRDSEPSIPIIEHQKGMCRLPGASSDKKIRHVLRFPARPYKAYNVPFPVALHAACDGLLIVSQRPDFYICNPATRRCAPLPVPHPSVRPGIGNLNVAGFYRHRTSGEHRVIWVVASTGFPNCFVLTVGSDRPRGIQCQPVPEHAFLGRYVPQPVHHRGSLHWAIRLKITVFDTVAETFRLMSSPTQLGYNNVSLLDMGGTLAMCRIADDCLTLDVWLLEDYDAETWAFQYQINLLAMESSQPHNFWLNFAFRMAVINERELLIQQCGNRLLLCCMDGVFLGNVESEEHGSCFRLTGHLFQESMISLPLFEAQEEDDVNKDPPFVMVL